MLRLRSEADAVISAITYAELMVGALRGQTAERLEDLLRRFPIQVWPVSEAVALTGARLRSRHVFLKLPDALIIATGEVIGAEAVLTADRRWAKVAPRVRLIKT